MGKFRHQLAKNGNNSHLSDLVDRINSNFDQNLYELSNQTPDELITSITSKLSHAQNVEFDQACLMLQRYLPQPEYLSLFLSPEKNCLNSLIARFSKEQNLNIKWMISEVIKYASSLCTTQEQIDLFLNENVRILITTHLFSIQADVLNTLKANENAIIRNLIECLTNLCDIQSQICHHIPLDWLQKCLLAAKENPELSSQLSHLFYTMSEKVPSLSLFASNIDQLTSVPSLSVPQTNLGFIYVLSALKNLILHNNDSSKNSNLLKIIQDYGHFLTSVLNIPLVDRPCIKIDLNEEDSLDENNNDNDSNDTKQMIREIDLLIESKLLIVDLLQSLFSEFLIESSFDEDDDWEEVAEGGYDEISGNDQDIEMDQNQTELLFKDELKLLIKNTKLLESLVNTINNDNENVFKDVYEIEHISNSIKFLKSETCSVYLLISQFVPERIEEKVNDLEQLLTKFEESTKEPTSDVYLKNFSALVLELTKECINKDTNSQMRSMVVELCIKLLDKFYYESKSNDFIINLCRLLTFIGINERNSSTSHELILSISITLLKLASISLLQVESFDLKLSAELLDCIIDLFSEDNLKSIEQQLKLIEKMKDFHAKFNDMFKKQHKKMKKIDVSVIQTVKDNLKPFIDYKIKNSK